MAERLVFQSKWSLGYVDGDIYIKEYRHFDTQAMAREIKAYLAASSNNLNMPVYIGKRDDLSKIRLYFNYVELTPFLKAEYSMESVLGIIKQLQTITWDSTDVYWSCHLLKDCLNALSYLKEDINHYRNHLMGLNPEVFIHGDLSYENLGYVDTVLFVFDFQHGCFGPLDWDLCYFAGSLSPKVIPDLNLTDSQKKLAEICAAVKLGRAMRKQCPSYNKKLEIFKEWKEWNQDLSTCL